MVKNKPIFIAHSWSDVGLNIQTKFVAKALSENFEIFYLSQSRTGKAEIKINKHLQILEWPHKRPNKLKDFLFLIKLIIQKKPQALIVHFGATNLCMFASWLLRVKYRICWMHTLSEQYYMDSTKKSVARKGFFFRKIAYRFATHLIVQNEFGKKDAIEKFKSSPHKIFKIYNGFSITEGTGTMPETNIKSVRYIGRLDKSKGIDILIKAFAQVCKTNNNIILEIAGQGKDELFFQQTAKQEGIENKVKFRGYFSNYSDAVNYIRNAWCLAVPSRIDNFPTVIIEALAYGVPVIAANSGGIPEMFQNNNEGFIVGKEDVKGLAQAIEILTSDSALHQKFSTNAATSFKEKYSVENHVRNVIDFLDNLN